MTIKSRNKTRARELQEKTGWSYSECLRLVREHPSETIESLMMAHEGK
jgi:hypothetical protein